MAIITSRTSERITFIYENIINSTLKELIGAKKTNEKIESSDQIVFGNCCHFSYPKYLFKSASQGILLTETTENSH